MGKQSEFIMKPKVDFCFKELMASAVVRQGFIAAVLGIKPEEVVQTELLPTHLETEHKGQKEEDVQRQARDTHYRASQACPP